MATACSKIWKEDLVMNFSAFDNDINTQFTLAYASDEVLVEATKAGEKLAFVELWRRHSAKVFKTVFRVTRNREDAEDALQDSFLKAFVHLKSFDGRSKFSTWLTRIAINSALMILRRKRSYPETSMDIGVQGEPHQYREFEDHSVDIEGHCVRSERIGHLRRAIHRLRPALREVVEIQQLHDVSIKEVAEIAGLSVAAAKSRMMRAKVVLRRKLH
jgi:RNA polymerase sigma factor (sigma-70 family)